MIPYQIKDRSLPQKSFVLLAQTVVLAVAGWLLLFGGSDVLNEWIGREVFAGHPARKVLLLVLFAVVYLRMLLTLFYFIRRRIPWPEAFNLPVAFAIYYIGFGLLGAVPDAPVGFAETAGVLLFAIGSVLNTGSEWQRHRWKQDPANKGKLYTAGLFRYSMHINYFGDVVWVTGLAIVTRNFWSFPIPVLLFAFFVFYNIPLLDRYLEQKYGKAFREYRRNTKKLIPFVY